MKKAISNSNQHNVRFVWCPSPVTIDKSGSWGEGNFQKGPNGAFLKLNNDFVTVSHLVQPNADKTAPKGWMPQINPENEELIPGFFDKGDIWVVENTVLENQEFKLNTLDGPLTYNVTEPSIIVCNDENGEPDLNDAWVMTIKNFNKNYSYDDNTSI